MVTFGFFPTGPEWSHEAGPSKSLEDHMTQEPEPVDLELAVLLEFLDCLREVMSRRHPPDSSEDPDLIQAETVLTPAA